MKTEVRQKTVDYEVYISNDGKEFDNIKDCELHDKILSGDAKWCPECKGEGEIGEEVWEEDYHTGAPYKTTEYHRCKKCHGKGYLEKKIKEVWE
jgi:DnaJ-class molecular chaperone